MVCFHAMIIGDLVCGLNLSWSRWKVCLSFPEGVIESRRMRTLMSSPHDPPPDWCVRAGNKHDCIMHCCVDILNTDKYRFGIGQELK